MVINLDGLTTEAIKNWVLAGISALTVVDSRETTQWHDLSAGFFWREEDVGQEVSRHEVAAATERFSNSLPSFQRLPPAAARIQALNPLVKINVLSSAESLEIMDPASSKLSMLGVDVVVTGVPSGPQGMSKSWGKKSLVR